MTQPNKPSITTYGAVTSLIDAVPVKDPASELAAVFINNLRSDATAVGQTNVLCHFQVLGSASSVVVTGSATWTSGIDQAYLGNPPTVAINSTGNWTVTMPSLVQDFQTSPSVNLNIHGVRAEVCSGSTFARFICTVTSSNTFTVQIDNGGATNLVGSLIQFWVD